MQVGTNSSVFIATSYVLDGPGIESGWGWDLPHPSRPALWPIQPPVRWAPGVKRLVRGVDHPPTSSDEIKERVELYLYYPFVMSWQVIQCTLLMQLEAHGSAVGWGTALQAGSIPDSVTEIFHWHNSSGRTMVLGLTQPLTEMSTRNISWGVKAAGV